MASSQQALAAYCHGQLKARELERAHKDLICDDSRLNNELRRTLKAWMEENKVDIVRINDIGETPPVYLRLTTRVNVKPITDDTITHVVDMIDLATLQEARQRAIVATNSGKRKRDSESPDVTMTEIWRRALDLKVREINHGETASLEVTGSKPRGRKVNVIMSAPPEVVHLCSRWQEVKERMKNANSDYHMAKASALEESDAVSTDVASFLANRDASTMTQDLKLRSGKTQRVVRLQCIHKTIVKPLRIRAANTLFREQLDAVLLETQSTTDDHLRKSLDQKESIKTSIMQGYTQFCRENTEVKDVLSLTERT